MQAQSVPVASSHPRIATPPNAPLYSQALGSLTLALPAAEPGSTKVGVRIFGDRDLGREWADSLSAAWIPADDGQGLVLTGRFSRPVARLEIQVGYHSPLPMLSGTQGESAVIGGPQGMRFAMSSDGLVTPLYGDDPTPRLNACEVVTLSPAQLTPNGQPRDE